MMRKTLSLSALMLVAATSLQAQSISISLRGTGSLPVGEFGNTTPLAMPNGTDLTSDALIRGAQNGFGYGLDVVVSLGMLGVYAGFDKINFDCKESLCERGSSYNLQGVSAGLRLAPGMATWFRPYLKGGVTFNSLEGTLKSGNSALKTDRAPGYEIGAGGNISLGGLFALTPQVRYVGQNLKAKIPGLVVPEERSDGVNYFTFDLGLSFVTPFGR